MTERIRLLLEALRSRDYRRNRHETPIALPDGFQTADPGMKSALYLDAYLKTETPVFFGHDSIGFYRSNSLMPKFGQEGNVTPDYARVITAGFDSIKRDITARLEKADSKLREFYRSALTVIDAVCAYADRYAAASVGRNERLCAALKNIPHKGAHTFYEACVFLKLIITTMRCNSYNHLTLGHFDRYMLPFFNSDRAAGVSEEELFETLENFFLSLNFDTDLYFGVQQGDNGQSMVLGGRTKDGSYEFNRLARLCMKASSELNLIDPKINMRVCKDTPEELYLLGTELTKKGLGFPQYCNDDVVIPGLTALGYDYGDAVEYTVAACWEFIVPGCALDVPNRITMNFPKVVNDVCHSSLTQCRDYASFAECVKAGIRNECDRLISTLADKRYPCMPYLSILTDGCIEKGIDVAEGSAKYNNDGCHGAGIANAADAMAAIRKTVFIDKSLTASELLTALDADFRGFEEIRRLLSDCPKSGNNDDGVDGIAGELMDCFAANMNNRRNFRGGIFRAGTGSAMEYIWSARKVPATADGRHAYEPYGSSFSPAITTRLNGPLSLIRSFTKFDMRKIINGGPLTMEIHDTTFRNEIGVKKVAALVRTFILLGGHQLQLNAINRDRLLEAKAHPENDPNLIVRVWGWSGYFNELSPEFQDHIISRTEFSV